MTGGEELLRRLVGLLQRVFYPETVPTEATPKPDQKPFYQDLRMLRMAVTFPARHIRDYGTGEFSEERYEEIFREIVRKIALHGKPASQMRRRAAYILKAVQDHWRHNWEEYRLASRNAAELAEKAVRELLSRGEIRSAEDRPMAFLAAVHDACATGRPKKEKPVKPAPAATNQGELF